jgi:hypothetical protein
VLTSIEIAGADRTAGRAILGFAFRLAWIPGCLVLVAGCGGPPQVQHENRELIVSLATAVSAKNTAWLESNQRLLEKHRAEGKCSDEEYQAFAAIFALAKSGDWKAAEEAVIRLRDAQEPTAEDLRNLESRKLGDHRVPKTLTQNRRGRGG